MSSTPAMSMHALNQPGPTQPAPDGAPQVKEGSDQALLLTADGGPGHGYNERAFQYFLNIERRRSERSETSLLLLLVDLHERPAMSAQIDSWLASKLVAILTSCVRDTDFIGWYR